MRFGVTKSSAHTVTENLSNVRMSNKQMWLILPFLLIGFLPLVKIYFFKPDASKDLAIKRV